MHVHESLAKVNHEGDGDGASMELYRSQKLAGARTAQRNSRRPFQSGAFSRARFPSQHFPKARYFSPPRARENQETPSEQDRALSRLESCERDDKYFRELFHERPAERRRESLVNAKFEWEEKREEVKKGNCEIHSRDVLVSFALTRAGEGRRALWKSLPRAINRGTPAV